jgi:hypothetical protein
MLDIVTKLLIALFLSFIGLVLGILFAVLYLFYDYLKKRKIEKNAPALNSETWKVTNSWPNAVPKTKKEVDEENERKFQQLKQFELIRRNAQGNFGAEAAASRFGLRENDAEYGSALSGQPNISDRHDTNASESVKRDASKIRRA